MGVILNQSLQLEKPQLICSWPGIGNIGILAVSSLINQIGAKVFGEIEPWDFFEPRKVTIHDGLLEELVFPSSLFHYQRLENQDIIVFRTALQILFCGSGGGGKGCAPAH